MQKNSCAVVGPPRIVGDKLHMDTEPHGPVVVRAIGPHDTWRVWPAGVTAGEAIQAGMV
jgi:hypothetical protein